MRVAVIGGTGFVGEYIVDALIDASHEPVLLVRSGSESKVTRADKCKLVAGSLLEQSSINEAVDGCDAIIYNVGILRENRNAGSTFEAMQYGGVVSVVRAAIDAGVERFLLMSANGVRAPGTPYQESKFRAEQHLKQSDLAYTIFRPSVIFGDPRGKMEIATQLYQDMIRVPVPAVGFYTGLRPSTGAIMMSPVWVKDVADAFVRSLDDASTVRKEFVLGGPQDVSWTEMLECIASAVGKKKFILPMPIALMKAGATLLDWIPAFPATRDQLTMLAEGNIAPHDDLRTLIGRDPLPFSPSALSYLRH